MLLAYKGKRDGDMQEMFQKEGKKQLQDEKPWGLVEKLKS